MNFLNYKFRASGVKNLMTNSRSKSDLLSKTAKSYLNEIWIEEMLGRKKFVSTPAMQKGTIVESLSMELVESVTGEVYFKNNQKIENDFISGTPDVIDKEKSLILDIKSSWDLWTFSAVDQKQAKSDYYWQLLAYMWLTGSTKSKLIYALVNTPEAIVFQEFNWLSYKIDEKEAEEITRKNHTFDDIDEKLRLKIYGFEFSQADVEELKVRIQIARHYLNSFSLTNDEMSVL